jgi:transcriptional regulator with XRE-family HTH domain
MDGAKLKRLRLEKRMTVRDLAEKSGVNHSAISEMERGKRNPHPSTIGKLADALEVQTRELLTTDTTVPPYYVPAATFIAWWRRLIELESELPEDMSQEVWLTRGQPIRIALGDLSRIGQLAGILKLGVEDGDNPGSIAFVKYVDPKFDVINGQVDLQQNEYHWNDGVDRATTMVATLERLTGIREHE